MRVSNGYFFVSFLASFKISRLVFLKSQFNRYAKYPRVGLFIFMVVLLVSFSIPSFPYLTRKLYEDLLQNHSRHTYPTLVVGYYATVSRIFYNVYSGLSFSFDLSPFRLIYVFEQYF